MSILGPTGKPILKKWEDQDQDEKLLTLRHGIVLTMQMQDEILKLCKSISNGVEAIIEAMEEYNNAESGQGREESDGPTEVRIPAQSGSPDESGDRPDENSGGDKRED